MRSNSGKDESRNNLHDPTLRDHEKEQRGSGGGSGSGGEDSGTKTTGLGSNARKQSNR